MLFLSLSHRRPTTPTVHAGARTSNRTHLNSDMQVPLFEQGRDQITHAPGVIIVQVCVGPKAYYSSFEDDQLM